MEQVLFFIVVCSGVVICWILETNRQIKIKKDDVKKLLSRYPLVDKSFIIKEEKEQNIENNQEIHEINKKLEVLEDLFKRLEQNANKC